VLNIQSELRHTFKLARVALSVPFSLKSYSEPAAFLRKLTADVDIPELLKEVGLVHPEDTIFHGFFHRNVIHSFLGLGIPAN